MNKAIFLDRDGTINVDFGYVYQIEKLVFINGVIEALKEFQKLGFKLIIITNQSGIARNYYSEDDMHKFNNHICEKLLEEGIEINKIYHCPHYNDNCECRKPKTKLFYDAALDFDIDFSKSFVIGDNERDMAICDYEPVKGILLSNKKSLSNNNFIILSNFEDIVNYVKINNI